MQILVDFNARAKTKPQYSLSIRGFCFCDKAESGQNSGFAKPPRKEVAVTFQNAISLPEFYNSYNHGAQRYPKYASLWKNPDHEEKLDILEDYDLFEKLKNKLKKPPEFDHGHIKLRTHSMNSTVFTQHESPQEIAAARFGGEPDEWMVLLNMESIDEFNFWDAGTLTYCIHKKDLAIKDFSVISASIESN